MIGPPGHHLPTKTRVDKMEPASPSLVVGPPLMTSTPRKVTPYGRGSIETIENMGTSSSLPFSATPPVMVDMEGFWLKDNFYLKELAFYKPDTGESWVGTFRPPFEEKCLKKSYAAKLPEQTHWLSWDKGDYPYSLAFTLIAHFSKDHKMYASGQWKCLWLGQFSTTHVTDIVQQLGYTPVTNPSVRCQCEYHNVMMSSCALNTCLQMALYYNNLYAMKPTTSV